jgi:outer membrane protein assembly factor BamB
MGPLQVLLALLPAIVAALFGLVIALFRPSAYRAVFRFLWHQKLFTACLVAVAVCWYTGFPLSLIPTRAGTAGGVPGDWPTYRGGPARLGRALDAAAEPEPTAGTALWSALRDMTIYSSPTVAGDRVYVSAVWDMTPFNPTGKGAIVCLDAATGEEQWRYAPRDFRGTFSSPVVREGRVVCGEGLHQTADARITCLDLAGRRLWELGTKSHVESTACIEGGRVYIGAASDGLYCVDLEPGTDGRPVVRWHLDPERYIDCESSPAVVDGTVYFGLGVGGNAICAVDASTGDERWRVATPYPVFSAPTVVDGLLLVGMGNGNYAQTAAELLAVRAEELKNAGKSADEIAAATKDLGPAGAVWCLDARTGGVRWKHALPETVLGSVACEAGRAYVGCRDGRLYCLSIDGKPLGQYDARGPIFSSPALGRQYVYFSTKDGRTFGLRADTLEGVWDTPLGSEVWGSPALARGHLYVGTTAGLRCVGSDVPPPPPLWNAGEHGGIVGREALPREVEESWRYPAEGEPPFKVTAPLAMLGDFAYAAGKSAEGPRLVKLSMTAEAEGVQRAVWTRPLEHAIDLPLAGLAEKLFVVEGPAGGRAALRCRSANDGQAIWSVPVNGGAPGQFTIDRQRAYIWAAANELAAFDLASGEASWRTSPDVGTPVGSPTAATDLLLVAGTGGLAVIDAPTGTLLWRAELQGPPRGPPLMIGAGFLLAIGERVEFRRLTDGGIQWQSPVGQVDHPLAAHGGYVVACTRGGRLNLLRLDDGQVVGALPCEGSSWSPLVHQGLIVFRESERWSAALLPKREAGGSEARLLQEAGLLKSWEWFITFGGDVRPATPLVGTAGGIVFADEKGGVVCVRPTR